MKAERATPEPTGRILFRTWSESDLVLAVALWGDPVVTRWIGGPFPEREISARLASELASQRSHGVQYWPTFLRSTGEHLGCCGLRPYRLDQGIYELGFHLYQTHWGQGYASEAAHAVIRHAFDHLSASGLFAGHHPSNYASRHLLEKLGFRQTGEQYYPPTGAMHPSYLLTAEAIA
jgi:RimJ/RimL family protein N-acetyltransferase